MRINYWQRALSLILAICITGCSGDNNIQTDDNLLIKSEQIDESPSEVKTCIVKENEFTHDLLVNGKLEAWRKTNLKFSVNGIIKGILVKESQQVSQGQHLAILENSQQQRLHHQNQLLFEKAILDYEDQILRLGYRLTDTAKIDKTVKMNARLRSGLSNYNIELQKSNSELLNTVLQAPFSGKIGNLKSKQYNNTSDSEYFCTLVDDTDLLVDFLVLEQELDFLRTSEHIKVSPFNNENITYNGKIETINPMIDKSGMINVKARIKNINGKLLDGMSVRVLIQKTIPKQLTVPKNAVLDRQGRKVVFTTSDKKTAQWNYVDIAYENNSSFAIKSGLSVGDILIYEGNFNLSHNKQIKVSN